MTSETIEQRLARVEKSVGLWKRATLGLAALGVAGLVLGVAYKPKTNHRRPTPRERGDRGRGRRRHEGGVRHDRGRGQGRGC